ncbi:MAG: beta-lactamase family protein [Lachnospiraceae bacterium]|nr:beta-lactamase family protein [Lachnospiraceae bacterium]
MDFTGFVSDIQLNGWNVYGAEVYVDGKLVHSYGDTDENIHDIYSATKAILSIAVGIAVDEKKFDIDKSILYYLPENRVEGISAEQRNVFEKISVKRLMTMSVGDIPFIGEGDSFIDFALETKIDKPEERVFNYSSLSSYLVGVALTEALGTDLGPFIEKRIFKPLGIDRFEYDRCPEGYFYGSSGTKLTVNELSKLGLLFYNRGVFAGERILSEDYIDEATSIQQMNREGGYGYFLWKYRDGFSINGMRGQKCFVLPSQKLVISFLSFIEEGSGELVKSMEKHIISFR